MKIIRLIPTIILVLFLNGCGNPWSPDWSKDKEAQACEKQAKQFGYTDPYGLVPGVEKPNTKDRLVNKGIEDRKHRHDDLQSYVKYK
jgi:hypothetical protein